MTLDELILQKLDDLCKRISKMEEKLDNHLTKKLQQNKTKKDLVLIMITIISTGIAVYKIII